jgi:predicted nuclease of predicted toxin-antitoxin system
VKLLFDENLSPRLLVVLADVYPDSAHVHQCGLASADDASVWQYAKDKGFTIVSKGSDFQERSILRGYPPKVIWLRASNCTSAEIESLLRTAVPIVARFILQDEESCLILGVQPKTNSTIGVAPFIPAAHNASAKHTL